MSVFFKLYNIQKIYLVGLSRLQKNNILVTGLDLVKLQPCRLCHGLNESINSLCSSQENAAPIPLVETSLGQGKGVKKPQPPPPNTKKPKAPKINAGLVEELKKLDEQFGKIKNILQPIFPFPKNNLHNAYAVISSQLGTQHKVEFTYNMVSQAPSFWQCNVQVSWPSEAKFVGRAASKVEASSRASLLTLQWLQSLGKINRKGEVELMVQLNKKAARNAPIAEIHLSEDSLTSIEQIINTYYENVIKVDQISTKEVPIIPNATESLPHNEDNEFDMEIDRLPIQREKKLFPHVADRRDGELFRRYEVNKNRREKLSSALPIHKFKEQILEMVENSSVVVIKGEPGCGKSTQVPQYIMESFAADRMATECNIVVTQPRRISAISLAERVAYERNERVRDVVGYHVRLYAKHPKYRDGYILFCSTGMLVQKMVSDSGLSGVTHVIVDEAHERDIPVDFLLLLLKRAQEQNPALKVIVMSATINAELFTEYYGNCPSISIPGFTYPVQHRFLDNELQRILEQRGAKFEEESARPVVNIEAVLGMITWIDENKPEGAILVFLPGWLDIKTVKERLSELNNAQKFIVVPAHSKLSTEEQKRIFEVPEAGYRKVILSTNIAETSLTINDVVYVVDTGAVKEERMDLKTGLVCLDNQWVSQANVRQRRGRAGRVRPGESYHLFTQEKYESLEPFPTPEVNRIPLTRSVLDVKMHTKDENISQFLSQLPEPPSNESVEQAVSVLQAMGALDDDENLTPLGKRIYKIPLDPYLSKALVYSCLFKCIGPMLSVATVLLADYSLFENSLGLKRTMRQIKQKYSPSSDHIAMARLYHQWEQLDWEDPMGAQEDCRMKGLVYRSMERTRQLRSLYAELLVAAKLVPEGMDVNDMSAPCNKLSAYDEFLKSVLLSGLGKLLLSSQSNRKKGLVIRTLDGSPAIISTESVNSKFKELPTPFLTYFKSLSSMERRAVIVHESTLLSPLSVVLFLPGIVTLKNMVGLEEAKSVISIEGPKPINIVIGQKEGEQLLHLRQVIWNVLDYLVENQGSPRDLEQFQTISDFRDKLLSVMANITSEQGANLDYTESGELRKEPVFERWSRG